MSWSRRAAALLLFFAAGAGASGQAGEPEPSVFSSKELRETLKSAFMSAVGCQGFPDVANCEKAADLYRKATALPGVTEAERHYIDGRTLDLYVPWIRNLRQAGQGQAAEDLSQRAFQHLTRHFDGGKHFHVLIESLPLQGEIVVTLENRGRRPDAAKLLGEARTHAERVWQVRQQVADNPSRRRLVNTAIYNSYAMEREVADGYARLSDKNGAGYRDEEGQARERARDWMARFVEGGLKESGEDSRILLAETELDLGDFHWATRNVEAARGSYATAARIACPLANQKPSVLRANKVCEEASSDPVAQRRGGRLRRRDPLDLP